MQPSKRRQVLSNPSHLECGNCHLTHSADLLQSVCVDCGGPLLARYQLDHAGMPSLDEVMARPRGQFRFHEVLPIAPDTATLGEGGTPLIRASRLAGKLWIKDEAQNPTGSFKSRGMSIAIPRNLALGASGFCLPSNGNAGGAAAAYAALHQAVVDIAVPANTPEALIQESRALGASVTLVDGTIAEAARIQRDRSVTNGWFSLATLHEPYRVEGKKMMGYELLWDLGRLPDVVIFPTGGGTGLVGLIKAFDEMEELGWIGSGRPRMVAVQVAGCAPIVKAFHDGAVAAKRWPDPAETSAFGLRVPSTLGDRLMLDGLRRTNGTAIAVTESELSEGARRLASEAGIWGSPEGGAGLAAYQRLQGDGWVTSGDEIVIFNTASAMKYL